MNDISTHCQFAPNLQWKSAASRYWSDRNLLYEQEQIFVSPNFRILFVIWSSLSSVCLYVLLVSHLLWVIDGREEDVVHTFDEICSTHHWLLVWTVQSHLMMVLCSCYWFCSFMNSRYELCLQSQYDSVLHFSIRHKRRKRPTSRVIFETWSLDIYVQQLTVEAIASYMHLGCCNLLT